MQRPATFDFRAASLPADRQIHCFELFYLQWLFEVFVAISLALSPRLPRARKLQRRAGNRRFREEHGRFELQFSRSLRIHS